MQGYLGEKKIDIKKTEYKDYGPKDFVLLWIQQYGSIDGAHHKTWVLDQVARILHGSPVLAKMASWEGGHTELRLNLDDATPEYHKWVAECKDGEDGPESYGYDEGIAP